MIDFGLVIEYLDLKTNKHYEQYETGFQGSPHTGSIWALEGNNHSRRDDLESLAYTFLFLIDQHKVPWLNETTIKDIAVAKRHFLEQIDSATPLEFLQVKKFINVVRTLGY